MLNSEPVRLRSSTQTTMALSVIEMELYAVVMTAQDMLYVLNVIKSIGFNVHLPMILEVDNNRGYIGSLPNPKKLNILK